MRDSGLVRGYLRRTTKGIYISTKPNMKVIAVTLLVALAAVAVFSAEPPQPEPVDCAHRPDLKGTLLISSAENCHQFVQCYESAGQRNATMTCPKTSDGSYLFFNYKLQACDWPDNVDCVE